MVKYVFKDDGEYSIKNGRLLDADKIGAELEAIEKANDGKIEPPLVVAAARDPQSALHPHFEWDDEKAAEKYRLVEARAIIRSICVQDDDDVGEVRQKYYSIAVDGARSYRSVTAIRTSADFQFALVKQAKAELQSMRIRYRTVAEICEALDKAIAAVEGKTEDAAAV